MAWLEKENRKVSALAAARARSLWTMRKSELIAALLMENKQQMEEAMLQQMHVPALRALLRGLRHEQAKGVEWTESLPKGFRRLNKAELEIEAAKRGVREDKAWLPPVTETATKARSATRADLIARIEVAAMTSSLTAEDVEEIMMERETMQNRDNGFEEGAPLPWKRNLPPGHQDLDLIGLVDYLKAQQCTPLANTWVAVQAAVEHTARRQYWLEEEGE